MVDSSLRAQSDGGVDSRSRAEVHSQPDFALHPQSLLMSLVGLYLLDSARPVSGASVVFVLGRLGVGGSAARSVLQRVTARGLIQRHKDGRRTYYSPTGRGRIILEDGRAKMFNRWRHGTWDGQWTFVDITIKENQRKLRHQVKSRLGWAGFARLPSGMWAAPGEHDVVGVLGAGYEQMAPFAVYGRPFEPTTHRQLVQAFDLETIATGFKDFLSRWSGVATAGLDAVDALVRRVALHEAWLGLTRADPQLPASLLPEGWPGPEAGRRFRRLDRELAALESPALDDFFTGNLG